MSVWYIELGWNIVTQIMWYFDEKAIKWNHESPTKKKFVKPHICCFETHHFTFQSNVYFLRLNSIAVYWCKKNFNMKSWLEGIFQWYIIKNICLFIINIIYYYFLGWKLRGLHCYQFFNIRHSWQKASELCKR